MTNFKRQMRQDCLSRITKISSEDRYTRSVKIMEDVSVILSGTIFSHMPVVGLYLPINNEVLCGDIILETRRNIIAKSKSVLVPKLAHFCIPSVNYETGQMEFISADLFKSEYKDMDKEGVLGFTGSQVVIPNLLVVPIVGYYVYQNKYYRIGYGKGFYDRYLQERPNTRTIGVAFKEQFITTHLTPEPHDIPLDFVISG